MVRRFLAALVLALPTAAPLAAQEVLPETRMLLTRDVDFPGNDLQALFDTTFEACRNVCAATTGCTAFTYNTRSNACFPKSAAAAPVPYDGAYSARILPISDTLRQRAEALRGDLGFLQDAAIAGAVDLASDISWIHPAGQFTGEALLQAARDREAAGDPLAAMRFMGGAVAGSDASDQWAEYARLGLSAEGGNYGETRKLRQRALGGAINAYLRAPSDPARVTALVVLARALEANDRARDMLPALRLAERIQPRDDVTALLDVAIERYGFRITENRVENELAEPRICAAFSEPLDETQVNYADYLRLPDAGIAVEASGSQLCLSGGQHGARYTVTFREGLPAASGETLARDVELRVYIRDRAPRVTFPGRAYVLANAGDIALPVETVNTDALELRLFHVTDRNLLRLVQDSFFGQRLYFYEERQLENDLAELVWEGTGAVASELNRDMTTRLPMADALEGQPAGAYALTARVPGAEDDGAVATQWFVLTDLGLTSMSGTDGLHVFLRGLGDAQAKAGVEVTLLSRSNRVLGTATTDETGYARFAPGLTRGSGGAAPAMVMAREGEADLAFLSLTDPAFDLSDRGVEGRPAAPPIDVFLATDRGAYRAGEVIHATALARDALATGIEGLPVTAILSRPDGVEYARQTSTAGVAGGHVFDFPVGPAAPRGTWTLEVKADPEAEALASAKLLVEDFLPERIDFTATLPDGPLRPGDRAPLSVSARYLFGAPAAGLEVEGQVVLRPVRSLPDHPGYLFGAHDRATYPEYQSFGGTRTEADGAALVEVTLPSFSDPSDRPVMAEVVTRVLEGSGRPVERRADRLLTPDHAIIGIRPAAEGVVPENSQAAFTLIAAGDGAALPVRWTVNRVRTRYQWYQQYGDWNWEPYTTRTQVASGEATLGATPVQVSAPVEWGAYEIVVEQVGGAAPARSSVDFYAGWYAPADSSTTPDMLELSLDAAGYAVGDTAQLRIVPRSAGTALVTVISNRLIERRAVEVPEGESVIPLEVTEDWGAGAYVTAALLRPMDVAAGQTPARALGLAYAKVDPGEKALSVRVDVPTEADPRGPVTATVAVDGIAAGETAHVTLAAVDLGILNLTGFESPDPQGHYFGQRRLGMEIRDLYGRLIDSVNGAMGQVRSGGDAGSSRLQSPPPTEELVAYFSGPVTVGADGTAEVTFDLPEFNGTVRFMAVAWTDTGVGSAEADVLVRDPVVVSATLPRLLAPGDTSRLLLEITHATGPIGRAALSVTAEGLTLDAGAIPASVSLGEKDTVTLSIPVTADGVGDQSLTVALTTPGGKVLTKPLTLGVRQNDPPVSTTQRFDLAEGGTFTLDGNVFAGPRRDTGQAIVSAGPLARLDAPALLAALDRYPYGCTEQVTSQALPLLYLSSVAEAMGLASRDRVLERVDQAIDRILARQASNGGFGLWSASSGDDWLDAYVTDFLSRARQEGYTVPDTAFRMAMDNLRNRVNYADSFDEERKGGEALAYALLVLAREGAANMGDLRYYADVKAPALATPLAAAQLGAALALYGDQTRADRMFAQAQRMLDSLPVRGDARLYRADYGTHLRDAAGLLTLAVEAGSQAVDTAALAGVVGDVSGPMSTQESVWTLMAAKAMVDDPAVSGLTLNGAPVEGPFVRTLDGAAMLAPLEIANAAGAATQLTLTTVGVPEVAPAAGGYGYAIGRSYYTMEGAPVDPSRIAQGDRMVVVLKVTPFEKTGARLMVDDPLPGGFEIDNPSLLRSGDIRGLGWLDPAVADHAEFRADRFLAALDWSGDDPFTLAYVVRAISPGSYHHPAASVEDMYRPRYRAWTDTGRVTVAQ